MPLRPVARVVDALRTREGGGFPVRRPFPTASLDAVDPFLLLDEMGPVEWRPGEAIGAPNHPHRGFETVTYLLRGRMVHRDSAGHAGELGPGDVQWMTAGRGVVHSELPHPAFMEAGGTMHGFQLWVNLPARLKLAEPRYQELPAAAIPEAERDGVRVRVIAGEALGVRAAIATHTPLTYLHFTLAPGSAVEQPLPADHAALLYIFGGAGTFGPDAVPARDGQAVLCGDGEAVRLAVPAGAGQPLAALLLAGAPLREPVARYGPFVMNTQAELAQAFADYHAGKLG